MEKNINKTNLSEYGGGFSVYLGTVLEDKLPESLEIKVTIEELFPYSEGEVKPKEQDLEVSSTSENSPYSGSVKAVNYITAIYFNPVSNRRYPPDIRTNEQVLIINYKNSDTYRWIPLGLDDRVRQIERYTVSVADQVQKVESLNDENTYTFEMDTRYNKRIMIRSAKSNEEKFMYSFLIDTKNNKLIICDDDDNEIMLDSNVPRIRLRNKNGCMMDLAEDNITVVAPKDFLLKVGSRAVFEVPSFIVKNGSGGGKAGQGCIWETNSLQIKGEGNCVMDFPAMGINGLLRSQTLVTGPLQAATVTMGHPGSPMNGVDISIGEGYDPGINNPNITKEEAGALKDSADNATNNIPKPSKSRAINVRSSGPPPMYGSSSQPGSGTSISKMNDALRILADAIDVCAAACPDIPDGPINELTEMARQLADEAANSNYLS